MPSASVSATAASTSRLSCARFDIGSAESCGRDIKLYSSFLSLVVFINSEQDRAKQEACQKRVSIEWQGGNVAGDEALPCGWIRSESEPHTKVADQVKGRRTGECRCRKPAHRHLPAQPATNQGDRGKG